VRYGYCIILDLEDMVAASSHLVLARIIVLDYFASILQIIRRCIILRTQFQVVKIRF